MSGAKSVLSVSVCQCGLRTSVDHLILRFWVQVFLPEFTSKKLALRHCQGVRETMTLLLLLFKSDPAKN